MHNNLQHRDSSRLSGIGNIIPDDIGKKLFISIVQERPARGVLQNTYRN